jgi:hypothetical protein
MSVGNVMQSHGPHRTLRLFTWVYREPTVGRALDEPLHGEQIVGSSVMNSGRSIKSASRAELRPAPVARSTSGSWRGGCHRDNRTA